MQRVDDMTGRPILSSGVTADCRLNRASLICRELVEVECERVFNNLPRGAIFNRGYRLQPGSHCGPDRNEQLRIISDAFRFTLLSRSFGRASHSLRFISHHQVYYITKFLHLVI